MPPHATHMCANWPLGLDRDEMAADDKGSIFITHEDDNETVTLRVRAPRSTHEATISLPLRMWSQMTEGSWAIGQRQAWIAEMVGIYGFINGNYILDSLAVFD